MPIDTPSIQGMGLKGLNIFFLKCVFLHIKVKGMEHRAQRKLIFCPCTHPLPLGLGQKVETSFSESSHVVYQKNGAPCKHTFCPYTHPQPLTWGQKIKGFYFLGVVMLHIKLKGMKRRAPCKHIFCPQTHPWPLGSGKNVVRLHIKLKGKKYRPI